MRRSESFQATRWLIVLVRQMLTKLRGRLAGKALLVYLAVAITATIVVTKTVDSITLDYLRLLLEDGGSATLNFDEVLNRIPSLLETEPGK